MITGLRCWVMMTLLGGGCGIDVAQVLWGAADLLLGSSVPCQCLPWWGFSAGFPLLASSNKIP